MSTPDNPYRPPGATVADMPPPAADTRFGAPGATVAAGRGSAWIGEGWTLFRAAPVMWILAMLIFVGIQMALGLLPVAGNLLAMLAGPIFMAGGLAFAHGIANGEEADLGRLFVGFRERSGALVMVAVVYFLLVLGLLAVFLAGGFFMVGGGALLASGSPDEFMSTLLAGAGLMGLLLLFLVFFAVLMLALAAYWFAPGLVLYAGMDAWPAMKASFRACLRNWLPFLVYGVLGLLVALGGMLLLVVGFFLVSMPVLMASYYASFRDIFGREA